MVNGTSYIGVIGPESSGKSTLARYLARRYNGTYIPEYAREYVERKGSTDVSWDELCEIARHQIQELESINIQRPTTNDQRLTTFIKIRNSTRR